MVRMVADTILPHAESGPIDHRKDAPPFRIFQNQLFHFWKQCRKEADPEYNDSGDDNGWRWRQSKFRVIRIRHFPTLISKIKWLWSELPLKIRSFCMTRLRTMRDLDARSTPPIISTNFVRLEITRPRV